MRKRKKRENLGWAWKGPDTFLKYSTKKKSKKGKGHESNQLTRAFLLSREFYESKEWKELRYKVIAKHGARCMACGRTPREHRIVIHVDHIKPRSLFPWLALEFNNQQVLCEDCNIGKSNKDQTDRRP